MAEIIPVSRIGSLSNRLREQGKVVVLVGGCFDILHPGHVIFLEKAREAGDVLIVILESDKKVKMLKGANRPIHSQKMRSKVLLALRAVDYVVALPYMELNAEYDKLIGRIKPDVIAITEGYANVYHCERAAKKTGAKLRPVTKTIGNHSTSRILNHADV